MRKSFKKIRKRAEIYFALVAFAVVWCVLSMKLSKALGLTGASYVMFFAVFFSLGVGVFFSSYLERKIIKALEEEDENKKNYWLDLRRCGFGLKQKYPHKEDYGL